jgi:predicted exporter
VQRLASLPPPEALRERLHGRWWTRPLSPKLEPFIADVSRRPQPPLLMTAPTWTAAPWAGGGRAAGAADGGWSVMLPLRPAPERPMRDHPGPAVQQALAGSGAQFVDLKTEFDTLYDLPARRPSSCRWLGVLAIVLLLAVTLRSPGAWRGCCCTLVLAVGLVMAGCNLAGVRLHLLHLVGLLLIVAVGSNYALFLRPRRWRTAGSGDAAVDGRGQPHHRDRLRRAGQFERAGAAGGGHHGGAGRRAGADLSAVLVYPKR